MKQKKGAFWENSRGKNKISAIFNKGFFVPLIAAAV